MKRKKQVKITPFQKKVYRACQQIPKGKVATYQDIAQTIGCSKTARAVGNALNKNPFAPLVPCHRVVRANGSIGGFASGKRKKSKILRREGITIKEETIDLNRFRYKYRGKLC
jgi:O-6-methylguanine DNA methyltransferase